MKTEYKGHEIETDHTGNFLTIDGISYVREWHNTDIEDAEQFAKAWLENEFEELVCLARPIDDEDWGSERQIDK